MTYENDQFELEAIPDYALQPAKEADEYSFNYTPRGATNRFDPAAYERVLHDTIKQSAESEEQLEMLDVREDQDPLTFGVQEELSEMLQVAQEEYDADMAEPVFEGEEAPVGISEGEEIIPVFTTHTAARPVFQPVFIPKTVPAKVMSAIGSAMSSKLKLVDMKKKEPFRMIIEEDILVPDIKPDLARILAMDGKVKLVEKDIHTGQSETERIRISGDLILQTLYVPEHIVDGEPLVSIESKIPFRNDSEMKAGSYSDLSLTPNIESIDYTVVNERKFRVRASVVFGIKEYSNVDVEVFEGLRDEEIQMLKEKINMTDVAVRKTEPMEIKEDLMLKDNMPEVLKILKYDINVVENHKQITKEKAVINASVYCNVLYLGAEGEPDAAKAEMIEPVPGAEAAEPVLYQGKTEFTQFIRLDGDNNLSDQNPAGSRIGFNITSLDLTAKEDGAGRRSLFALDMNVDTSLELYKNIEKEVVTDVYHHLKELQFETDDIGVMALSGSGVAEISAREIVNIPERYGNVDKVVYISGNINEKRSFIEQAKSVVEGVVTVNLICTSADNKKTAFNVTQDIPFRNTMEIPGITQEMTASNDIVLKELWFDKINNKQIEVNAGILVNTTVSSQKNHQLVKNISFLESPQDSNQHPGIILYITRTGDTIWKVAKRYRTTIDELRKVNDLEVGREIKPGTKLLIVAKNH